MVAKMHRMHLPEVGEGVIYVPSGVPFEADTTPKYPAGSFMRLGNKEFIYAIAGATLNTDFGAMNSYKQKVIQAHCTAEVAAGETEIVITIDSDGSLSYSETVTKDELAGGQFIAFPGSENSYRRGIIGNSEKAEGAGVGGDITITLDSPTPIKTPIEKWCECIRNPYGCVKSNQGEQAMVMGMPTVAAKIGQGLWLQVSGPNWAAPVSGAGGPGGASKLLECVFVGNGSIAVRDSSNASLQLAGVVIAFLDGGGQASPFIMLQIAH